MANFDKDFFEAAENGHEDIIDLFLMLGEEPTFDAYGRSPMAIAAQNGHKKIVAALIVNKKHKKTAFVADKVGRTPLSVAIGERNYGIAIMLMKIGVNFDSTELTYAYRKKDYELCCFLLENGANPNVYLGGVSVISEMATAGSSNLLELFLKSGAEQFPDKDDNYPIHNAVTNKNYPAVVILLRYNCGHPINVNGDTPLHIAARLGHMKISLLLSGDGGTNKYNKKGETPLEVAYKNRHFNLMSVLKESFGNVLE